MRPGRQEKMQGIQLPGNAGKAQGDRARKLVLSTIVGGGGGGTTWIRGGGSDFAVSSSGGNARFATKAVGLNPGGLLYRFALTSLVMPHSYVLRVLFILVLASIMLHIEKSGCSYKRSIAVYRERELSVREVGERAESLDLDKQNRKSKVGIHGEEIKWCAAKMEGKRGRQRGAR